MPWARAGSCSATARAGNQESLPAGFEKANLTSIAFAGSEAIVAAGERPVGQSRRWLAGGRVRACAARLGARGQSAAVRGCRPFRRRRRRGGSRHRDRARRAERPLAILEPANSRRDRGRLPRPCVAAAECAQSSRSSLAQLSGRRRPAEPDPNVPPPILPPFNLPGDGYLLRETAAGWDDEERTAFACSSDDTPVKSDPILGAAARPVRRRLGAWAAGAATRMPQAGAPRRTTAAAGRSGRTGADGGHLSLWPDASTAPPARPAQSRCRCRPARCASRSPATPSASSACAELAPQAHRPRPDPGRRPADGRLACRGGAEARAPFSTRATGSATGLDSRRRRPLRGAARLRAGPAGLPGARLRRRRRTGSAPGSSSPSFAGFPAPLGSGSPPRPASRPRAFRASRRHPGARTHYAFDSSGPGGTVRVVVIDNSPGSLAASDPYQNPPEAQLPWLEAVLADARAKGIPTIVMGNRSLNTTFIAEAERRQRRQRGRPRAGRRRRVGLPLRPARREPRDADTRRGARPTIPSFGTGTLGYRSQLSGVGRAAIPPTRCSATAG